MYYKNRFMFINCLIHNKKKKKIIFSLLYFILFQPEKSEIANTSTNTQHEFIFNQIHNNRRTDTM